MAADQIGNDSYITMTPGSAVAGQLQQILTSKRLEARQAMLDDLNRRNVESEMATRADNAATNKAYRENMEADRSSQELGRRTALMSPHMNLAGSDLDYLNKNAPSLVDPGQTPTDPLAPGEEGPTRPAIPAQFHGLPAQLETARKTQVQQEAIKALNSPEFENMDTARKAYIYEQATGHQPSAGVINPKSDDQVPIMDANGNPTGNWMPANGRILPREPKDPTPPGMTPFQGEDADGNPVNLGYNPRTNSYVKATIPDGLRIVSGSKGNAIPHGAGTKPAKTTPATWNLWSQSLNGVLKGNTQAEGQLNQQAAKIALELGIPPEAAEPVLAAFRDPTNRKRQPTFEHSDKTTADQSRQLWDLLTNGFKGASPE